MGGEADIARNLGRNRPPCRTARPTNGTRAGVIATPRASATATGTNANARPTTS